ncbi:unnamed protein product [Calicophoron daubneyi]|uniref:Uncharacterized protein n=1 Tax=Calicophoron daubneyi TaxID=300641 RepID=A0AAV2TPB3_CALDB
MSAVQDEAEKSHRRVSASAISIHFRNGEVLSKAELEGSSSTDQAGEEDGTPGDEVDEVDDAGLQSRVRRRVQRSASQAWNAASACGGFLADVFGITDSRYEGVVNQSLKLTKALDEESSGGTQKTA